MIRNVDLQAQALEEKRKALGRKEAGQAYRKSAEYFGEKRDNALKVLEDLLSGKKEQLANKDVTDRAQEREGFLKQPEMRAQLHQYIQNDAQVRAHEQAHQAVGNIAGAGEVMLQTSAPITQADALETTLEKVKQAALAPAQPSAQDLRVAASAAAQLQQLRGEAEVEADDIPDFVTASTEIDIPERFLREYELDASKPFELTEDLKQLKEQQNFKTASTNYYSHMIMVKNGYRDPLESTYSLIA